MTRFSLRFRVFLFFCFLAIGALALIGGALAFGWSRAQTPLPTAPFVTAFVAFAFLNTGLVLGVWLLFDENVAKPIIRLSTHLRLRAHSGVDAGLSEDEARYLGDLAPAASALTQKVGDSVLETAAQVAHETERLKAQSERLTALLTEVPIATILLNPAGEIVLYDGQAAAVLTQVAPPRLRAPLATYFDMEAVTEAMSRLGPDSPEIPFRLHAAGKPLVFDARIKALGADGHMIFVETDGSTTEEPVLRPLVFDFDLMNAAEGVEIRDMALADLCYVPFDTETTGLSVETDDIVQLGAVRVLNGRIVEGEVIDTFVDPGRPIPPASTRIHRVTDSDVAGAPDIVAAGRAFHKFAEDAVLVAHNAPFDIGLLRRNEARIGVEWSHPVLDTVLLSAVVFGTTGDHSLDALCERLAVEIPEELRHTALGDARVTAEALVRLLPLLEGKGIHTFGDLVKETRKHGRLLQDLNG